MSWSIAGAMHGCGASTQSDASAAARPWRLGLAEQGALHEVVAEVSTATEPPAEALPRVDAAEVASVEPAMEPTASPPALRRSARSTGPTLRAGEPAPGLAQGSVEDFIHEQGVVGLMVEHAGRTGPPPYERLDFDAPDALWRDAVQPAERARVRGFDPDTIRPPGGDAEDIVRHQSHGVLLPRSHCVERTAVDVRPAVAERARVREAMRRQVTGLLSCRSSDRPSPRLPDFALVVGGTGAVVSAEILSGSPSARQVRECLLRQLGRWRMPPAASGAVYRVQVHRVQHC